MSAAEKIVGVGPTVDHATYIGASDIAAIVGLHPYKTSLDVWAEKTGRMKFAGNARTRAGNAFERTILQLYAEERGVELGFTGTLVPSGGPTGATPDAITDADYVVQAKMVGFGQANRWSESALGADGIPTEVLAQVHFEALHASMHFGRAFGMHAVAQLGTEQRVYDVPYDADFAGALKESGERFWRDHVATDRMPAVDDGANLETVRAIYKGGSKQVERMPDDLVKVVRAYCIARDYAKSAEERKDALAARICAAIGDRGGYALNGLRVTWFAQKGRVDWEACARALGATDDIADQHRKEQTRVLRVTDKEG